MNRLKELREEAMITVRKLSERSGVSEDTITKIENTHRKGRGMTMRKLAKALNTTPHQLFPEDFEQTSGPGRSAPEILAQDDLIGSQITGLRPSHTDVRGKHTMEEAIATVHEAIRAVEEPQTVRPVQRKYPDGVPRMNISERQQKVLITVLECGEASPSTVADRLEISVSTAYRDLSVLEEHGLVQAHESGKRLISPLGRDVVEAIFSAWTKRSGDSPSQGKSPRDRSHYDEALDRIAILMKAYESVAGVEPRRLAESEAKSLFYLQESLLRAVGHIASAASQSPVSQARENLRTDVSESDGGKSSAKMVQAMLDYRMSDPPPMRTIQADIEGLSQTDVLMAILPVIAAHDIGHGPADPYKEFRSNLKRASRDQRSDSGSLQQTSTAKGDS